MTRVIKASHSFTCKPRVDPMNHTCLAFSAEARTHLPTPERWKAELALVDWWLGPREAELPQFRPGPGLNLRPLRESAARYPLSHKHNSMHCCIST